MLAVRGDRRSLAKEATKGGKDFIDFVVFKRSVTPDENIPRMSVAMTAVVVSPAV